MKFLITGGEGFIGRNIKQSLIEDHHEVETLDIEGNPDHRVSILQFDAVMDAMGGVDGVFHMAATTSPPQFESDLISGFNTNVMGTLNVLKAASDNLVKRVVLASSSAVYGSLTVPGNENMQIYGHENMYATTKLFDEYLGRYFNIRKELEVVSLRFFNTYGIGENSKGMYSSVISKFLDSVLKKEKPVIFGNGSQSRDFIYVKDLAVGAKTAMQLGTPGQSYNIGTGESYSFNSILSQISQVLGKEITPEYQENPFKNYQIFTKADMEKTFTSLKWKPKYSLKDGIAEMCNDIGLL